MKINGGELQAITTLRDQTIPGYIDQLDQVAQQLVTTVNAQHRQGVDLNGNAGGDFFQISRQASGQRISVFTMTPTRRTRITRH